MGNKHLYPTHVDSRDFSEIGHFLNYRRWELGLTFASLAEQLNSETGHLRKLCTGEKPVSAYMYSKMVRVLDLDASMAADLGEMAAKSQGFQLPQTTINWAVLKRAAEQARHDHLRLRDQIVR